MEKVDFKVPMFNMPTEVLYRDYGPTYHTYCIFYNQVLSVPQVNISVCESLKRSKEATLFTLSPSHIVLNFSMVDSTFTIRVVHYICMLRMVVQLLPCCLVGQLSLHAVA